MFVFSTETGACVLAVLPRCVSSRQRNVGSVESGPVRFGDTRTNTTVTGWHRDRSLDVTSPRGRIRVDAKAVVLAVGARERPRPARLIPGDRPSGVYTTGQLQNLVHIHHKKVGAMVNDNSYLAEAGVRLQPGSHFGA